MSGDRSEDSFAALFEKGDPRTSAPRRGARVGDVLEGTVVQVGRKAVFLELEGKRQGFIEILDLQSPEGEVKAALGDKLRVRVVHVDAEKGIRLAPTLEAAVAAGASVSLGGPAEPEAIKVAVGQVVSAVVDRVENYGLFLQIEGTKGRAGRGLAPVSELGVPRGTDLRKAFPLGTKMKAKILDLAEGKMRLSVRALKDDEERAQFEGFREKEKAGEGTKSLGTLGDLLKSRK